MWDKFVRWYLGEDLYDTYKHVKKGNFRKIKTLCDPLSAGQIMFLALSATAATAGATAYSASQERKAAEKAADAQKEIAQQQIDAVKEQEELAQQTAQDKLRAAQARKSQTILTRPELEEVNTNVKTALGV